MADSHVKEEASTTLSSLPLNIFLNSKHPKMNNNNSLRRWVMSQSIAFTNNNSDSEQHLELRDILDQIQNLANDFLLDEGSKQAKPFRRARRVAFVASGNQLRVSQCRGHDILQRGSVLQAWVEDEHAPSLSPSDDELSDDAVLVLFAVETMVSFEDSHSVTDIGGRERYGVVRRSRRIPGELLKVDSGTPLQLIRLTDGVRRVGLNHACHKDDISTCFSVCGRYHSCNASILAGHQFYYYDRQRGFPPRMA